MIENAKVLGLITARGGSKGVPRKNVRMVGGKPLIAWTIDAALKSKTIDHLILSSDDEEIISVAREWGCEVPFVRPDELASDTAGNVDVVRHALQQEGEGYDYVVLLQPTSPLRTSEDIDATVELCHARDTPTCVTVCAVDKTPYWMFKVDENSCLEPLFPIEQMPVNRQAANPVYMLNGAVYVSRNNHIIKGGGFVSSETVAHIMPPERSLDIDTEQDLALMEFSINRTG